MSMKALYTLPQSVGIAGGRPSSSYYFIGMQADNLFYLDPHHTCAMILLRPLTQAPERECEHGIPIRQTTPERGSVSPPSHHLSPTSPASNCTSSSTFSYLTALPSTTVDKWLLLGRRPHSLGLCWRVRIVRCGERRRLGSYPNALHDIVQRCGASNVPL